MNINGKNIRVLCNYNQNLDFVKGDIFIHTDGKLRIVTSEQLDHSDIDGSSELYQEVFGYDPDSNPGGFVTGRNFLLLLNRYLKGFDINGTLLKINLNSQSDISNLDKYIDNGEYHLEVDPLVTIYRTGIFRVTRLDENNVIQENISADLSSYGGVIVIRTGHKSSNRWTFNEAVAIPSSETTYITGLNEYKNTLLEYDQALRQLRLFNYLELTVSNPTIIDVHKKKYQCSYQSQIYGGKILCLIVKGHNNLLHNVSLVSGSNTSVSIDNSIVKAEFNTNSNENQVSVIIEATDDLNNYELVAAYISNNLFNN